MKDMDWILYRYMIWNLDGGRACSTAISSSSRSGFWAAGCGLRAAAFLSSELRASFLPSCASPSA